MAETYTIGSTAFKSHNPFAVANVILPDSKVAVGAQNNAMRTGTQFLVKMPDGSLRWHRFDAERSTSGGNVVVVPV